MAIWFAEKIKSLAEAKRFRRDEIARLRDGGKKALASLLAHCRKKSRCNLTECPVCEYRKKRAANRISAAAATKTVMGLMYANIYLTGIVVVGKRRPLNEAKVKFLATSMREIGQQTPITVRMIGKKKIVLVAGLHRLAAAKLLGWDSIRCSYMVGDKVDARMWELSENLHRADLRVLERAESIEEWRMLIREKAKVGQNAPPGGHQPKDAGIKKTAKELGLTREEVRRAKAIAGISPKAKTAAITAKLDNSQSALLEIARQPTPSAQLKVIKDIVERRRVERARGASAAEQRAATEITVLKADLAKNIGALESLEATVANQRKWLHDLKDAPAAGHADVSRPATAPSDDHDGSAIIVRRALSEDEQEQYDDLERAWAKASTLVQERFLVGRLSTAPSAPSSTELD